jgi:hypothetical protein
MAAATSGSEVTTIPTTVSRLTRAILISSPADPACFVSGQFPNRRYLLKSECQSCENFLFDLLKM